MTMNGHDQSTDSFERYGVESLIWWLVVAAIRGETLTYGEVAFRLETQAGFAPIPIARRIGVLAGMAQSRLLSADQNAPLLNLLIVSKTTGLPGNKAGEVIAVREGRQEIAQASFAAENPEEWHQYIRKHSALVRRFAAKDWIELLQKAQIDITIQDLVVAASKQDDVESDDGLPSECGRPRGEGEFHKKLRLWVRDNPHEFDSRLSSDDAITEFDLLSGDRVDVVLRGKSLTAVVEVKSRKSNDADLLRGVYQCIKYRSVLSAMELDLGPQIEAWLVTEDALSEPLASLVSLHNIRHFHVPQDRK